MPPAKIMTNNINNKSTLALPIAPPITTFTFTSNANIPPLNHPILLTFASALSDVAALKTTLHTLRLDYLALETEMRDRMDEYVAARDEAKSWEKRCVEAEERENSNFAVLHKGLKAQNERLARKRPFWGREEEKKKEETSWERKGGHEGDWMKGGVVGRWKRAVGRMLRERCGLV